VKLFRGKGVNWPRGEQGVAMVTVLLVGAVLTVTASAASFSVIQDLRAGNDDQKATGALAYAEAGTDRMLQELRSGASFGWGSIKLAGCWTGDNEATPTVEGAASVTGGTPKLKIAGAVGNGTYATELVAYKSGALAPDAGACVGRDTSPRAKQQFAVTSTGSHPAAKRVIRQIITIDPRGLPIGIYADGVNGNGNVDMNSLSLVSPNNIQGRDKIAFAGRDPYYTLADFYPGFSATEHIPAAAHAVGELTMSAGDPSLRIEHKSPAANPDCSANPSGQSLWDGSKWGAPISSGCPGQPIAGGTTPRPPTTLFTTNDLKRVSPKPQLTEQDYQALKDAAKNSGLYCYIPTSGSASCLKQGAPVSYKATWQTSDVPTSKTYITYFEFQGGDPYSNTVKWKADISPCSSNPSLNESTVLIVRNGSLSMQSGAVITGAVIIPEGRFDSEGTFTTHGTIIAKDFWLRGGATFLLSDCWIQNMPVIFLNITPSKWTEVDR
jgi:hypothetical protein